MQHFECCHVLAFFHFRIKTSEFQVKQINLSGAYRYIRKVHNKFDMQFWWISNGIRQLVIILRKLEYLFLKKFPIFSPTPPLLLSIFNFTNLKKFRKDTLNFSRNVATHFHSSLRCLIEIFLCTVTIYYGINFRIIKYSVS